MADLSQGFFRLPCHAERGCFVFAVVEVFRRFKGDPIPFGIKISTIPNEATCHVVRAHSATSIQIGTAGDFLAALPLFGFGPRRIISACMERNTSLSDNCDKLIGGKARLAASARANVCNTCTGAISFGGPKLTRVPAEKMHV